MSEICPSCNQLAEIVHVEKSGNVTMNTYSCGHKHIQFSLEEKIQIKRSLEIEVKDQTGKVLVESKIEDKTEKRLSRKPGKAMQLVFKEGKIVHPHCKSNDCGNEWKTQDPSN